MVIIWNIHPSHFIFKILHIPSMTDQIMNSLLYLSQCFEANNCVCTYSYLTKLWGHVWEVIIPNSKRKLLDFFFWRTSSSSIYTLFHFWWCKYIAIILILITMIIIILITLVMLRSYQGMNKNSTVHWEFHIKI